MRWVKPVMMVYAVVYDLLWDTPLVDVIYEAIAAQLPPPPCDVREIGAGTGLITRRLLDDGYTVLAVEPCPAMVRRLRRRAAEAEIECVRLESCGDAKASALIAVDSLHMMENQRAAVARMRNLVDADGVVVLVTPTMAATVATVVAEQGCYGVRFGRRLRFRAIHAALAPMTLLSGASVQVVADAVFSEVAPRVDRLVTPLSRLVVLGPHTDPIAG